MYAPNLNKIITAEKRRQNDTLSLIASENIPSPETLALLSSVFETKYAEGYPGKRYYPGNLESDKLELLAQKYARQAFALDQEWIVNVQPHSGSPANLAVYLALAKPGEKIMGLELASGGHLTHGHPASHTGKIFNSISYGLDSKGCLDYQTLESLALKHRPKIIISGTTSYPRAIDFAIIGKIARRVGSYHVADISHIAGLVAARLHPSPFPHADVVTTTTHKTLAGPRGAIIFTRDSLASAIQKSVFPGLQGGPHLNTIAALTQALYETTLPTFDAYSKQVLKNAASLGGALQKEGFELVTGGTDNHLLLINLKPRGIMGQVAEKILEKNNIIANRNSIPGDQSPLNPNGVRLGTPSATRRGMREKEMFLIASSIAQCLLKKKNVAAKVRNLCQKFPAWPSPKKS